MDIGLEATIQPDAIPGDATPSPVRIGRFVVLRSLGQGAMGVVYAGYDNKLERKVAIKVLRGPHDDDEGRRRMLREAKSMAQISHPNVVPIY